MEYLVWGMMFVTMVILVLVWSAHSTTASLSSTSPTLHLNNAAQSLIVRVLHPDGKAPRRGSPHSAGWDIHSRERCTINPHSHATIMTGISVQIPEGSYGRLAPRSGLANKHSLHVGAGVIDRDYDGEIGVVLFNHSSKPYTVEKHDRIAQMILTKYDDCDMMMIDEKGYYSTDTTCIRSFRGHDGFGSTGYD